MKPYHALRAMLIRCLLSAFGIFFVLGIALVEDYVATAAYGLVVLLEIAFAVLSVRFYIVFGEDFVEFRQGYLYSTPERRKNRTRESFRSPFCRTVIYSKDVRRLEIDQHRNVLMEKTNGDRLEISFWGYFAEKEILERLRTLMQKDGE